MTRRTFLETIIARRREAVARLDAPSLREKAERVRNSRASHAFRAGLAAKDTVNIIAEFKRASPSLGAIREDARIDEMIPLYQRAGACAISVLTEPTFFSGSIDDLREARALTALPILRKDFLVAEPQIDEAAAAGADAVLLIVAALADRDLQRLRRYTEDALGLDALVEVHTFEELRRAMDCGAKLIGVNNRDLRTFTTSLETSERIAAAASDDVTLVSESGISSAADIERLAGCGYRGFLVGESLMRSSDPASLIRALRGESTQVKVCGVTNVTDARICAEAGVQMIGLNFSPQSPRCISQETAAEIVHATRRQFPAAKFIGVFVDQDRDFVQKTIDALKLDGVQLHGDEAPKEVGELRAPFVIKALRVGPGFTPGAAAEYDCDAILLDSYNLSARGGTGEKFDWSIAVAIKPKVRRLILAGGLTSENVRDAIAEVQPFAVDVCSGVESGPGVKNHTAIKNFIGAVQAK